MIKQIAVRGIRKTAHITRRVLSVGANYSGRIENKAHRIINGMDDTIKFHDKVLFEKLYYESLPYVTPVHPALPMAGREGRVTLLVPSLQNSSFFGGTATALIFAAMTAQKTKRDLLIIETLKKGSVEASALQKFFDENNTGFAQEVKLMDLSPRKYNHYGYIDMHPDDIFICSAWWDAYVLKDLPLTKKFIYLIQDYEPIFYNNSDLKVLAESTYHAENFLPVCNTELMLTHMVSHGYNYIAKNGLYFEPAVNVGLKVGRSVKTSKKKKKLFIYGRPSVERNLFFTAIKAVDEAFSSKVLEPSEWECYMAGQDGLSNILLKSGKVINTLGKMSTDEYYEFAKDVDLAVSLMMAPHPSYPPLELASLGAAVVTTSYEKKQDLSKYSGNIVTSGSDAPQIVDGIKKAIKIPDETKIKNAKNTGLPADWHEALDKVIDRAVKSL